MGFPGIENACLDQNQEVSQKTGTCQENSQDDPTCSPSRWVVIATHLGANGLS